MFSKNRHYAKINNRFDERADMLVKKGFKYTHIPEWDIALFVRPRIGRTIPETIQAAFVQCADSIVWEDKIASLQDIFPR